MKIRRLDPYRVEIERQGEMRSCGLIFADAAMMAAIGADKSPEQVANVAALPGLVGPAMAMPDIHWGYGFPIGGVAAFDLETGVVSPGGVGYDINCGVRLLTTPFTEEEVAPQAQSLLQALFRRIPSGVGSSRRDLKLSHSELNRVLQEGASYLKRLGMADDADLEHCESHGCLEGADAAAISEKAKTRGADQLGTLGSGNHFIEVGRVAEVYDEAAAHAFGLDRGMITLLIHTGSRGLGYQVCDDALAEMQKASRRYGIALPDRQLCCAPLSSPEAKHYLSAMSGAANFAFANRQAITHFVRESFSEVFRRGPQALGIEVLYDVAHNIAKIEEHEWQGRRRRVCVHRKGATRSFAPGHQELPAAYRPFGQPVIIPGDMGHGSYVLAGAEGAMRETFGSTCHGAGRRLSRTRALQQAAGRAIDRELAQEGILLLSQDRRTLAEEMPEAYKDVNQVVEIVHGAGLSRKVAKLLPWLVIKG